MSEALTSLGLITLDKTRCAPQRTDSVTDSGVSALYFEKAPQSLSKREYQRI